MKIMKYLITVLAFLNAGYVMSAARGTTLADRFSGYGNHRYAPEPATVNPPQHNVDTQDNNPGIEPTNTGSERRESPLARLGGYDNPRVPLAAPANAPQDNTGVPPAAQGGQGTPPTTGSCRPLYELENSPEDVNPADFDATPLPFGRCVTYAKSFAHQVYECVPVTPEMNECASVPPVSIKQFCKAAVARVAQLKTRHSVSLQDTAVQADAPQDHEQVEMQNSNVEASDVLLPVLEQSSAKIVSDVGASVPAVSSEPVQLLPGQPMTVLDHAANDLPVLGSLSNNMPQEPQLVVANNSDMNLVVGIGVAVAVTGTLYWFYKNYYHVPKVLPKKRK
jgi:hypothetical protein